ncbi:suppressor of cytokine signaling 2-like [Stegodyphus dumicola]|uniref:suppressor of cytokine signaling 2-like n=1 Tax=Stegodyphus dumicola TaxID=202533 RepID=UPI0015B2D412|nr:suppressor of cytokine signaling 2-like [Stegodyphus dumicola]XP_035210877.1 suppressor of cytokine signaling 2-like [Stegodyphus dumicola]XP_035210878.1 suppressor of cytokine signaling 2-like [Stegodyphus dumicola]XP_035210879.1 suppressor of cytokine signaling 2-like [Stegodyphus dumicola]XP_035228222.1 suppressor of cytokine signaling 2-like [Stegodyphus dumicola]XP_035228223.1 suppressor of cytokine signaling 2-like [Stegodyphus dumicola]XP_035228224.1 suppressor of cytokine signaling
MLTSYQALDSTFSNPVATCPSLPHSSSGETHHQQQHCFQLPLERQEGLWLNGCSVATICQEDFWWRTEDPYPKDFLDFCQADNIVETPAAMEVIDPEDDLKRLISNDLKLRLSGYYYGNLSWVDASHLLKQCKVGTFLVRDSEHCSYLYALSVQTRRGPTSCRIEYDHGRFRLDSSEELTDKMPRFECVTDLVDHYVQLTKNLPRKSSVKELSPVWLDMDEENSMDVPVQIYKPLYKGVRSLQHICRVNMVRIQRERYPSMSLSRTIEENEYKVLPTVLKDYLKEYPYSQ